MTENVGFIIELEGSDIIVTMPETIFMVAYRMRDDVPELTAHFVQDDEDGHDQASGLSLHNPPQLACFGVGGLPGAGMKLGLRHRGTLILSA